MRAAKGLIRRLGMVAVLVALAWPGAARAVPWLRPLPPARLDDAGFARLRAAVQAEPFGDGKLARLREVAGGRRWLFDGAQVVTLLGDFGTWGDRVDALRLPALADRATAVPLILREFDPAPGWARSLAREILQTEP